MVSEQLGGRGVQTDANMKNSLKFLVTAAGVPEVRLLVVQRIEGWIQNPKVGCYVSVTQRWGVMFQ